jgi:hypothetical protein
MRKSREGHQKKKCKMKEKQENNEKRDWRIKADEEEGQKAKQATLRHPQTCTAEETDALRSQVEVEQGSSEKAVES